MGTTGYRPADWGESPEFIQNSSGFSLFKAVELEWSKPVTWEKSENKPVCPADECLYIITHDHGNARTKDRIVYVGLTTNPSSRFYKHDKAIEIRDRPGKTQVSFATFNFIRGKNKIERKKAALEEIEHLLIWTLWHHLENERKVYTLPGMGTNGGDAWQITNAGHRFHGQMPQEIVYPWMLTKSGRNRSQRA